MTFSTDRIEFKYSPVRLIGLTLLGIVMTALSAVVTIQLARPGSFAQFASFVGIPLFSAATLLFLWRLVNDRDKAIMRITDTGFTDLRLAPEEIPWRAIERIGTVMIRRQKILVLDVDPQFEKTLTLSRKVRWSRSANASLGIRGLSTTTQGLNVDYQTVSGLCQAHLLRAHPPD